MKKLLLLSLTMLLFSYSYSQNSGWNLFEDPMGDKTYAYCDEINGTDYSLSYKKKWGSWSFVFDFMTNLTSFGNTDPQSYDNVSVNFKVGSELINLSNYISNKYPKYSKDFTLKVAKGTGYFLMVGYDSNYKFKALSYSGEGNDLDINGTMVELIKKASKISIDYKNQRYYYSGAGFTKAVNLCK